MATIETFHGLLKGLGTDIDLSEILSEDGLSCAFAFDGGVTVNIGYIQDSDSLLVFSNLGAVEAGRQADIHAEMLKANYLFADTGGGSLGIEPESGDVALNYRRALDGLDQPQFEALIEQFAEVGAAWMDKITAPGDPEPVSGDRPGTDAHKGIRA